MPFFTQLETDLEQQVSISFNLSSSRIILLEFSLFQSEKRQKKKLIDLLETVPLVEYNLLLLVDRKKTRFLSAFCFTPKIDLELFAFFPFRLFFFFYRETRNHTEKK